MALEFFWVSATILTFGTLALAGNQHLRNAVSLRTALHLRFGIGQRASGGLAKLIGCYELTLGATGLAAAALGPRVLLRLLMGVALVTYVVYTWHVTSLLSRGVSAPCGCTSDSVPANGGTVARTLALALAAAFALFVNAKWVDTGTLQAVPVVVLLVAASAGATFTTLLWNLPSAVAGGPPKAAGRWGQFEIAAGDGGWMGQLETAAEGAGRVGQLETAAATAGERVSSRAAAEGGGRAGLFQD